MHVQDSPSSAVDFATLRRTVVDCQIRTFGVTDQRLLARFLEVPRETFASAGQEALVYSDRELNHPLGAGGRRGMLAPLVLARMLQATEILPTDRVLDVAGATGYTAALVASLCASVVALESDEALSKSAAENFAALGLANAAAVCGPLAAGVVAKAPFDVILVNGAAETGLEGLLAQLAPGGRMVAFQPQVGRAAIARLYRKDENRISERALFEASAEPIPEFAAKPAFAF